MNIYKIKGSELNDADLETINYYRTHEFDSEKPFTRQDTELMDGTCVVARNENHDLTGFARLINVDITIKDSSKPIFGLASVFTTNEVRGNGYGTLLMRVVKMEADENDKSVVGFSMNLTAGFYQKTGFQTLDSMGDRFIYKADDGHFTVSSYGNDTVCFYERNTDLAVMLQRDHHTRVYISKPHW